MAHALASGHYGLTQREIGANRLQSGPRGVSDAMAPVVRLGIGPVSCASFTGGTAIIHSVYRHLITRDAAGTPPDLRRRGIRSSSDDPSATGWDLERQIPACRAPSMRRMASEPPHRADRPRSGRAGLHPVQVATLGHRHPGKVVVRTTGSTTRRSPSWREGDASHMLYGRLVWPAVLSDSISERP